MALEFQWLEEYRCQELSRFVLLERACMYLNLRWKAVLRQPETGSGEIEAVSWFCVLLFVLAVARNPLILLGPTFLEQSYYYRAAYREGVLPRQGGKGKFNALVSVRRFSSRSVIVYYEV